MLSVVIPTLNAAATLPATLAALIPAVVRGTLGDVVIVDGGSADATRRIVEDAGATWIEGPRGRGAQLAAGAAAARGDWLLFLHADTALDPGWVAEAERFMERQVDGGMAAAFRFALDDDAAAARWLERGVALRCAALKLPYGDQGLLIHRALYSQIGGFREMPLMEDVDIVRRIGRRRLRLLRTAAVTSAERYRRDGWLSRPARNLLCLALYYLGASPARIARLYARDPGSTDRA